MPTAARYIPPDAPPLTIPPVPYGLSEPVPARAAGSWEAVGWLLAGCVADGLAAYHALVSWGWDPADVGAGALLIFTLCSLGLYRQASLLRAMHAQERLYHQLEKARARRQVQAWDLHLAAYQAAYTTQQGAVQAWAGQWGKAPAERPPVVNRPTQTETLNVLYREVQDLKRARVANPAASIPNPIPPDADATTRNLEAARLLAGAYHNGPARRLVATALRGEAITHAALSPRYMTSDAWRTVTTLLARAGVVVSQGERRPYRLADDLARLGEDACHVAVIQRMAAAGIAPGDLPSDLPSDLV